jgi:hypothetical protein
VHGCGARPSIAHTAADSGLCAPPHAYRGAPSFDPDAQPSARVTSKFSQESIAIARAIGALADLDHLVELASTSASDADVAQQKLRVRDRIDLAELDLESVGAELECESDRAEHVGLELHAADSDDVRDFTIASVLFGAAAAVTSGILTAKDASPKAQGTVAIVGGVGGAAFGIGALTVHHSIAFMHPRNLLREIWNAPKFTPLVPVPVWIYLARPEFGPEGKISLRDALIKEWKRSGQLGGDPSHPDDARVHLLFGDGGTYDADALETREAMLDQVQGAMNLMHQELRDLERDVQTLK